MQGWKTGDNYMVRNIVNFEHSTFFVLRKSSTCAVALPGSVWYLQYDSIPLHLYDIDKRVTVELSCPCHIMWRIVARRLNEACRLQRSIRKLITLTHIDINIMPNGAASKLNRRSPAGGYGRLSFVRPRSKKSGGATGGWISGRPAVEFWSCP